MAASQLVRIAPTMSDGLGTRLDRLRSYYTNATLFYSTFTSERWAAVASHEADLPRRPPDR